MRPVITAEEARKITGGRAPHVPVEYESALKSLAACCVLDDAKYWSDKADALAAWAKIYRSDEASVKARMLKLHAYRRMGEIARELRPSAKVLAPHGGQIFTPGPRSLLMEAGLKDHQARSASFLARLPQQEFEGIASSPKPPSPEVATRAACTNQDWEPIRHALWSLRSKIKEKSPSAVAVYLLPHEVPPARKLIVELIDWLDELDRRLPDS